MEQLQISRIVIAGTSSGVGKTTIVAGLLAVLRQRGIRVQSYKIGPDYIDPGYHRLASGVAAHNLDTWLVPEGELVPLFAKTAAGADIAVIEGVMGLFDGGRGGISSTAAIARALGAPVVVVLDARSAGESVAATALGFATYDPGLTVAGFIVNRLGSETHRAIVAEALGRLGLPVFGCLQRNDSLGVGERHLGLTPVTEQSEAALRVDLMRAAVDRDLNVDELIRVAAAAPPLRVPPPAAAAAKIVRIGVARDEAFTFYYPESLTVLEELGAELVPFSPLNDRGLPAVDGLIIGGGFPEMFLHRLSANTPMLEAIRGAVRGGLPAYAECGGLMYLAKEIAAFDGRAFPMVGLVPAVCRMESRLQTVGYVEATALGDNVLCRAGEILRGHEFHFSRMELTCPADDFDWAFQFRKMRTGNVYLGGFAAGSLLAAYLHMHFAGNRAAAAGFIARCRAFRAAKGEQR
jgi:cobyrinic acid a,c-diamide synthase